MKRFLDLLFDDELKFATRGDETIQFSKTERLLLSAMTKNTGRLMSRDALLEIIAAGDDERSDRNIDYVVNRLRNKLKDKARSPRYLATRYGEGYVWLAAEEEADPSSPFIVIGPAYGLAGETFAPHVTSLIERLQQKLSEKFNSERKVVILPGLDPVPEKENGEYSVELTFLHEAERIHGRSILRSVRNAQIISIQKFLIDWPKATAEEEMIAMLSADIVERIIFHKSESGTQKNPIPLEVSMHEASRLLALGDSAWLESGAMIARKQAEQPDDPKLAIMWASHLYATLVFAPYLGQLDDEKRSQTEQEIEAICLHHLPRIQDYPILRICIAQLLFYIDRGHIELVENLMQEVFDQEVSFSSIYPLLGKLKGARGHFDEAIRYYDHALLTAEPGSQFHIYVMVLKLKTLLAADRRQQVDREAAALFELSPKTLDTVGIFLCQPDEPIRPHHAAYLDSLGSAGALAMVKYLYHNAACHFMSPIHRERVYAGFAGQIEKRYGVRFVPPVRKVQRPDPASAAKDDEIMMAHHQA